MKGAIGAIEIIVARLELQRTALDEALASLSSEERGRAARLRLDPDRRRYIAAHSRLRRLLGARCGLPPGSLQLECGRHGKPALGGSRLQFSLSRSGELAGYAFAWDRPVGIDVEAIRPFGRAEAIAALTFAPREWRAYAALCARDKEQGFFRGWTRTEALAKALGGGLGLCPGALEDALEDGWVVESFEPAPGFAGALAYRNGARCR